MIVLTHHRKALIMALVSLGGILLLAESRAMAQVPAAAARETTLKAEVSNQIDSMQKQAQVMVDTVFSFGELGFQEVETTKYLTGILEKEGFRDRARRRRHPHRVGGHLGPGKARHLAGLGRGRHPAGLAEARRRLPRAADRRRARARRRPQLRRAAQYPRRALREENHGARAPAGHAPAMGGHRRRTGRRESALRSRRTVQQRGRGPLRARQRQLQRSVWRISYRDRPGIGRIHIPGRSRPCRRCTLARPQRAGRRRTDGRRLEFPPRTPAHRRSAPTTSSPTAATSPT